MGKENKPTYDFNGWATKYGVRCTDGRTIIHGAFSKCDGKKVPLVWNHNHTAPDAVVGHCILSDKSEGLYTYAYLNDSPAAEHARAAIAHGDIDMFSICAGHCKEDSKGRIFNGDIKEVSLVLSAANPEAYIESYFEHSDDDDDTTTCDILLGSSIEDCSNILHSDEEDDTNMTPNNEVAGDEELTDFEKDCMDIANALPEEQRETFANILECLSNAISDDGEDEDEEDEENEEDVNLMKRSAFAHGNENTGEYFGSGMTEKQLDAERNKIWTDVVKNMKKGSSSMKETFLEHADEYGIDGIETLFPEPELRGGIEFIKRRDNWVSRWLKNTGISPFSRVKSMFADITGDEARAKGYTKGNYKLEQVFHLLKRVTQPTTFYAKQKIDRDDMIDLEKSYKGMTLINKQLDLSLAEEFARACLIGDGRPASSNDKIDESCIRPILNEEEFFCLHKSVDYTGLTTDDEKVKKTINFIRKSMDDYEGSGDVTLYTYRGFITDCILLEDEIGRPLYTLESLKARMGVSYIEEVDLFKNQTRTDASGNVKDLIGIIVNPNDYVVGTDNGGEITSFEQFDINYNQQVFLKESRCSGALTKWRSAIVVEKAHS